MKRTKPKKKQPQKQSPTKEEVSKRVEDRVYSAQSELIEVKCVKEAELLKRFLPLFLPHHFEEVVTERAVSGFCGFPCCGNAICPATGDAAVSPRFHVSVVASKVFDISQAANFCCIECNAKTRMIASRIESSPLLIRPGFFDLVPHRKPRSVAEQIAAAPIIEHDCPDVSSSSDHLPHEGAFDSRTFRPMQTGDDDDDDDDDFGEPLEDGEEDFEKGTSDSPEIKLGMAGLHLSDYGWASMCFSEWITQWTTEFIAGESVEAPGAPPRQPEGTEGVVIDSVVEQQRREALTLMIFNMLSSLSQEVGLESVPLRPCISDIIATFEMRNPVRSLTPKQLCFVSLTLLEFARRRHSKRDPMWCESVAEKMKLAKSKFDIRDDDFEALLLSMQHH